MRTHLLIVGWFAICSRMTTTSARENIIGASVLCAEGICCAGRNRAASCLDWAISTKWRKISPKELKNKWEHCAVVIIACPASGKGVRTSTTNCNCNQQNLYSSLEWNRFNFSAGYGSIIWQFLPVSFLCFRLFTGMGSVDAAAVRFTCSIHLFIYSFTYFIDIIRRCLSPATSLSYLTGYWRKGQWRDGRPTDCDYDDPLQTNGF